MTDRIPTEVLANGALRYAEYDSGGNFVQYRYLMLDDEPTIAGTPLNKSNLLSDAVATALGLTGDATVNQAINALAGKARIQTGNYTGTGTYGASYPVSVTLDFEPLLFIIGCDTSGYSAYAFPWVKGDTAIGVYYGNTRNSCAVTQSGNSIAWYSTTDAGAQMNYNGTVYHYFAVGAGVSTPYITTQPTTQTGAINSNVTFSVVAVGDNLAYQWQYYTGGTWSDYNIATADTANFTLKVTSTRLNYAYRCRITDGYGTVIYTDTVGIIEG